MSVSTITGVISGSTVTITPTQITGYASSRPSKNIVHTIPDSDDVVVTLGDAGPRTGSLTLLFDDEADAATAEGILQVSQVFTLADSVTTTVGMKFVVTDTLTRQVASDGTYAWTVTFGFQETL